MFDILKAVSAFFHNHLSVGPGVDEGADEGDDAGVGDLPVHVGVNFCFCSTLPVDVGAVQQQTVQPPLLLVCILPS